MATILRAYNDDNEKFDLDLFNEQQFLLDISAIESGEIGKVFGISSQQFALPPTKNNQDYFGNLDIVGSTPATSFIKTQPCQVLKDGIEVFSGILYLDSVITNQDGDTIYNVVVVNEIVDFKYEIENLTFGDLDWSDYAHDLTYANVSQSWDLNLFDGEVVYPLIDYGFKGQDLSQRAFTNGGDLGTFTSPYSPLSLLDFKPAIRVSTILNKIFSSVGYSYTSSFFESAYADTIYEVSTRDDNRGVADITPISQSFKAETNSTQVINDGDTLELVDFNDEIYDNSNNYNPVSSEFTAGVDGAYSFAVNLDIDISNTSFPNGPASLDLDLAVNGVGVSSIPTSFYNLKGIYNTSISISTTFQNVQLTSGDDITLRATFLGADGAQTLTITDGAFECYSSPQSLLGGAVDLGGIFNPKDKVLDFINGLIQKFNLVIEPLPNERNVLSIETFNDWVDAGDIKDWTEKVDRSTKWEIKHPLQQVPKKIYFSDVEDKDEKNQYAIRNRDRIFGDFTYESDSDLADGERRIGSYFAPTPMKYIDGTTNFIIPQLWALDNGTRKRIAFKPRILHYLGKKRNDMLYTEYFLGGNITHTGVWFFEDESGVVHQEEYYPQFHHVSALPANNRAKDLHFNAFQHWEYHQNYVNANTIKDAVYEYWSFYINELYDVDSRLITLNLILEPTEIPTIKLNDKIFIDGHYYRINKISGANLTNETSVQVELLKTSPRKLRFPRRRISLPGDFGSPIDVTADIDTGVDDGFVQYVGFVDNTPITSSDVINVAGNMDGFATINGTSSYVPTEGTIPTSNIVMGGSNYIDDRSFNNTIVGGGNIVESGIRNSSIYGDNNLIANSSKDVIIYGHNVSVGSGSSDVNSSFVVSYSSESIAIPTGSNIIALNPNRDLTAEDAGKVVIANAQLEGSFRETYSSFTASSGGTTYLTSSSDITFHNHFEWSGGDGYEIVYIPSASLSENDGLKLLFTAGNGFTGARFVYITPSDGTINGSAEHPLNTAYGSVTAQVVNNNWLIIQENQ